MYLAKKRKPEKTHGGPNGPSNYQLHIEMMANLCRPTLASGGWPAGAPNFD